MAKGIFICQNPQCGKEFDGGDRGKNPRFCCRACYDLTGRSRKTVKQSHICQNPACSKEFIPKEKHKATYCSKKCHFDAKFPNRHESKERSCDHCRSVFTKTVPHQKFCSQDCARAHRYQNHYGEKTCPVCQSTFFGFARPTYCSVACSNKRRLKALDASGTPYKQCGICAQWKPASSYLDQKASCKSCLCERHREWVSRNRPAVRAYHRKRWWENRDHLLHQTRLRYYKDIEKRREYNQRPDIKEKHRQYCANRRARKMNAPVYKIINRTSVINRDNSTCYLCGKSCYGRDCTLDHVVPLSKGGHHAEYNLRVACQSCNSKKNAKSLDEYIRLHGQPYFMRKATNRD